MVAKKTTKKTVKKVDNLTNIIEEEKPITEEDKILGVVPEKEEKIEFDYENPKVKYRITNLILNNNPIIVTGASVESFIGSKNTEARKQLLNGAKVVITYNSDKKENYKIEVL